jgi:MFS family permease
LSRLKKINTSLLVIGAIFGLEILAENTISPILPLYITSIGVTSETLGMMFSIIWLGMIISEGAWGWISDKLGVKIPLLVATFISGLLVFSFTLTKNIPAVFIIFLFWGVARSAVYGPIRGYIGANTPQAKRATFMALINGVLTISSCLGTLPSGFIVDSWGYHWSFYTSIIISIIAGLILIGGLRLHFILEQKRETQAPRPINDVALRNNSNDKRILIIQCLIAAFACTGWGFTFTFIPLMVTQVLGESAGKVGIIFGVAGFLTLLVSIPLGMLADRRGRKRFIILGLLISTLGLAVISFVNTYIWLLVFFTIFDIGLAMFSAASMAFLSENTSPGKQGTAMGLYGGLGENLGVITGTFIGGFLWDFAGPKMFLVGALAGFIALLICIVFFKNKRNFNDNRVNESYKPGN